MLSSAYSNMIHANMNVPHLISNANMVPQPISNANMIVPPSISDTNPISVSNATFPNPFSNINQNSQGTRYFVHLTILKKNVFLFQTLN